MHSSQYLKNIFYYLLVLTYYLYLYVIIMRIFSLKFLKILGESSVVSQLIHQRFFSSTMLLDSVSCHSHTLPLIIPNKLPFPLQSFIRIKSQGLSWKSPCRIRCKQLTAQPHLTLFALLTRIFFPFPAFLFNINSAWLNKLFYWQFYSDEFLGK